MSIRPGNTHGFLMQKRRLWWQDFLRVWTVIGMQIALEAFFEKEDAENRNS